jgi:hypothetical protein
VAVSPSSCEARQSHGRSIAVYASAIAGAAPGAWIAFAIARRGPVLPASEFDDDPGPVIEPAEAN